MSDFVVNDMDSVSGEDNSKPLFYPTKEYTASAASLMDAEQVCGAWKFLDINKNQKNGRVLPVVAALLL